MKGIILAGGSGTRLYPVTLPTCKQLLPVYDKPMIYYPLSTLMLAGIREVLIISTEKDIDRFEEVLGSGEQLGMKFSYAIQPEPKGLSEAFIIGESWLAGEPVCMILGDNILFGNGLAEILQAASREVEASGGAHNFAYYVSDPERFGIIELDKNKNVLSVEEKPVRPKSNYASLGVYMFDGNAAIIAKAVVPSARGEIEITSMLDAYLQKKKLKVSLLGRGFAYFDAGTHDSLLESGDFVMTMEKRTGLKIGCIEEVAFAMGFINHTQLRALAEPLMKSGYGAYLNVVASERINR